MQTVPAKLTDAMVRRMDQLIAKGVFSSRSEYVRDAVRQKNEWMDARNAILRMKGALKDKVPYLAESLPEWRMRRWREALKKTGGDEGKAVALMRAQEDATLPWF